MSKTDDWYLSQFEEPECDCVTVVADVTRIILCDKHAEESDNENR